MKKSLHYLGIAITLFLNYGLTGCSPIVYAPNSQNVPLFREKHEFRVNLAGAVTGNLSGQDVQVAYAPGSNIGLMLNGTFLEDKGSNNTWSGHGSQIEAGTGYFRPIGRRFAVEAYGGGGFGSITNIRENDPRRNFDTKFAKYFVQPALGFSNNWLDVGLSTKVALVRFSEPFSVQDYRIGLDGKAVYDQDGKIVWEVTNVKQNYMAYEPAITLRTGWKFIKLQFQYVHSFHKIPEAEDYNFNIGLTFNYASRFK